jgi:hypothetical protein
MIVSRKFTVARKPSTLCGFKGGEMTDLILGQVLTYSADPFTEGLEAARVLTQGAVAAEAGRIAAVGEASDLRARYPQARLHDHGSKLISAGFIDAHVHYPQTAIIASWGKRLIDWLNTYTFPEEMRFRRSRLCARDRRRYLDLVLATAPPRSAPTPPSTPQRGCDLHRRPVARDASLRRQDLHGPERPRRPARHGAVRP